MVQLLLFWFMVVLIMLKIKSRRIKVMAYKRISRNDAYMNVANVEDDEDVIDLLEVARAILKHIKPELFMTR